MTLKPCFWGSCFFKTHTETAFDSEQLEFHLRVGLNQRSVVKIHVCVSNDTKSTVFGSCFFKTHTGIAFDGERFNFHLRVGLHQRICYSASTL